MTTSYCEDGFYLAFDSSGLIGSVALAHGPDVLARTVLRERAEHASRLVPAIAEVMEEAGVDRSELTGLVVGEGPGSFTGIRVAAATAKGLAAALHLPIWAVSSLAATALAYDGHAVRYVLFDARSDRVYGGCYAVGAAGVETLVLPHGGTLRDVLAGEVPAGAVFCGEAAVGHGAAIEGAGFNVLSPEPDVPVADGLLRFLAGNPEASPIDVDSGWEPRYVRPWKPDAAWSA
jgi:tRNA threonylcarbamoyladenosine biosynthesis protein TsaB